MSIDYIVNSNKPYPSFIKDHVIFSSIKKIDKIFPKIGLPNCSTTVQIVNTEEAINVASQLRNNLYNIINNVLRNTLRFTDKDVRKERDLLSNYATSVYYISNFIDGDKVCLKLYYDVSCTGNIIFKRGERVFSSYNKLRERWNKIALTINNDTNIQLPVLEELETFKKFSSENVAKKNYQLVFSSNNDEGAWDIATMSMRGIASCQSWTAPQSRALIGSISNKFVGVMYLASAETTDMGPKMLRRCVVRYAVHNKTKKPAILMDKIYPSDNGTVELFKNFIKEKSKLNVLYAGQVGWSDYYLPEDTNTNMLDNGEFTYMDYRIAGRKEFIKQYIPNDNQTYNSLHYKCMLAFEKFITSEKNEYEKTKHLKKRTLFSGGMPNLLKHLSKNRKQSSYFCHVILDSFRSEWLDHVKNVNNLEEKHFNKYYYMFFMRNIEKIRSKSWEQLKTGSHMKSFSKCSEKLFNASFNHIKKNIISELYSIAKGAVK